MASILVLFIIALVSLIAVRVASTALMMTGLSWDTASFQAYSAFFGVGFTTKEAEMVVNHPVRRRIIRDLILAGNIGLTSALATLIVSLMQSADTSELFFLLSGVVVGLVALLYLSRIGWLQKILDRLIRSTLEKTGMVCALDYELLLRIQHGYVVSEIEIMPNTYLEGRTLRDSRPWDRGLIILSIKRGEEIMSGLPGPLDMIFVGDILTAYGKESAFTDMVRPLPDSPGVNIA